MCLCVFFFIFLLRNTHTHISCTIANEWVAWMYDGFCMLSLFTLYSFEDCCYCLDDGFFPLLHFVREKWEKCQTRRVRSRSKNSKIAIAHFYLWIYWCCQDKSHSHTQRDRRLKNGNYSFAFRSRVHDHFESILSSRWLACLLFRMLCLLKFTAGGFWTCQNNRLLKNSIHKNSCISIMHYWFHAIAFGFFMIRFIYFIHQ